MKHHTYSLQLLSPCFNGGARPKDFAELRVPSLRGQIRWWYREATPRGDEKGIFGGVGRDTGSKRSSVTFRIPNPAHSTESMALLPHKNRGGGERPALPPQAFDLHCRCREETFTEVDRAVRLWVLLGGLGCRCNRAAGSVWYAQDAPGSPEAFAKDLRALTPHSNWDVRLAPVESLASGGSSRRIRWMVTLKSWAESVLAAKNLPSNSSWWNWADGPICLCSPRNPACGNGLWTRWPSHAEEGGRNPCAHWTGRR